MAEGRQFKPKQKGVQECAFRNVELFKTKTLGTGSYGAVCKAKCDELICAAKLLHPVLSQMHKPEAEPGKEHRQPFQRFKLECCFFSSINHPNIVQYLGTYRDPETNAPVLLMELMDESLTQFLESSPGPIHYHINVNHCYDVAQALAFLHTNGIIHRDLSSNNVLLLAGRAKVTDFGMSKLYDIAASHLATMTKCPGTSAFMPPEALNKTPLYTEKLDVFSLGVMIIQIVTRKFPTPTDHLEKLNPKVLTRIAEGVDVKLSSRMAGAQLPVPEAERRHAHISLIDPAHPLLPIALDCLKDKEVERPSSQQLCQTLGALKETAMYKDSLRQDKNHFLRAKGEQIQPQGEGTENQQLAAIKEAITKQERETRDLKRKDAEIRNASSRLRRLKLQEESHQSQGAVERAQAKISFRWQSLPDANTNIRAGSSAVSGHKVYFKSKRENISEYDDLINQWSVMPVHPIDNFSIVCIDNILTTVGGGNHRATNELYSLVAGNWVKKFPHMPNKRILPAVVYTNSILVVAGGINGDLATTILKVDVLQLRSHKYRWSSVSSFPFPMIQASTAACGDNIYMSAGAGATNMVKCSLSALIHSRPNSTVWENIADLPVNGSALAVVNDHLLAIGGGNITRDPTRYIHRYDPATNTWNIISQMSFARIDCLAAVLPGNKLMIVGADKGENMKKAEVAFIQNTMR